MKRRALTLGEMLRHWRVSLGKTQGEAGAEVGVPQATWSRWESGQMAPTLSMVKRIGGTTGLSIAEMIEAADMEPRKAG